MAAAKPKPEPTFTIGPAVDRLHVLRESKRDLEAAIKVIEDEYLAIELKLMEKMTAEGTTKSAGKLATVSITTGTVADVVDWEAFGAWVIKKKYLHLLQRRVSDPAYRELQEKGVEIPGVQPFTKRRLNLRVAGSA